MPSQQVEASDAAAPALDAIAASPAATAAAFPLPPPLFQLFSVDQLILVGAPGSGKSTAAKALETCGWVRVSEDDHGKSGCKLKAVEAQTMVHTIGKRVRLVVSIPLTKLAARHARSQPGGSRPAPGLRNRSGTALATPCTGVQTPSTSWLIAETTLPNSSFPLSKHRWTEVTRVLKRGQNG